MGFIFFHYTTCLDLWWFDLVAPMFKGGGTVTLDPQYFSNMTNKEKFAGEVRYGNVIVSLVTMIYIVIGKSSSAIL